MTDEEINNLRNLFMTIVPVQFQTLYSGTNNEDFAVQIIQRYGWHSEQAFRALYCQQALGGTAVYGPGIYLTNKLSEAQLYGSNIMEFQFNKSADYLDLADSSISKVVVKTFGGGKQKILAEPKVNALIRVTSDYFVLRTPVLVSVSLHG
ncbi:hypothetical protein [Methylomonas methanica]|uniref:Uncharacterized protein n=1 Tax=Methylomonas methanica (strain DSM 25384 / MC09) TaxID=857087 RepID=F9ZWJ4_METMM|nr:hypothetical protein [Methylomonas methanica]AEG00841.1 hypothetical protein Metme_2443 [Methylomonas methanica MC09]